MKVLRVSLALIPCIAVLGSCNEEKPFETAGVKNAEQKAEKSVISVSDDGSEALRKGGGSNEGDPIVYVQAPSKADPANKYIPYKAARRAPLGNWVANQLVTKSSNAMTIASKGDAPTRVERITITTNRQTSSQTNTRETPVSTPSINQVTRNSYSETFTQAGVESTGMTGEVSQSRSFAPIQRGRLDILLVVDNSGSMQQEVRAMAAAFAGLLGRNYNRTFYGSSTTQPTRYPWGASYSSLCSGISGNDLTGESKYNKCRYMRSDIYRSDWRLALVDSSPTNKCKIVGEITAEDDGAILNYPLTPRTPDGRTQRVNWYSQEHHYWSLYGYTNSSYKYYSNNNRYNPFLETFMRYFNPANSTDSSAEEMLKKARWALEGKSGTNCDGSWVRDNAAVAVFVATDEGHQCPSGEESTCSIDNFKSFRDNFSHPLKVFGLLSYGQWDQTQVGAFSSYLITGYQSGSNTVDEARYFGHNSFPLFSKNMWDDLNFIPYIYSPLDPNPNAGSVTVQITTPAGGGFAATSVDVARCTSTVTSNCYKEVLGTGSGSTGAVQLVNYQNLRDTATIAVSWKTGGTSSAGTPFVNSWTLTNDPLPDVSTMTVKVVETDGTTTTLTRGASDGYTLSGRVISVDSANVKTIVPQGARLTVDYKQNIAMKTSFDIGSAYQLPANAQLVSGSARITIILSDGSNGATLSNGFSFDGSTVTFNSLSSAPAEGESFQLAYRYSEQITTQGVTETIITDYDYTKRDNTDTNRSLSCVSGGSSITCNYTAPASSGAAGTISFAGGGLRKDDVVIVTEHLQRSGTGVSIDSNVTLASVGLPNCEMDEAIEMHLGARKCSSLGVAADNNLLSVTSGGTIELLSSSDCGIISDILTGNESHNAQVKFSCKEVAELPDDFLQMREDFFEIHRGKYKFEYWQIMVDGQELQLSDSSDLLIVDYKIVELKGEDTSDPAAMRELFGGNDKRIKVVVRLYEAL